MVGDADLDGVAFLPGGQFDGAAGGGVFGCVLKQIAENPFDQDRIKMK